MLEESHDLDREDIRFLTILSSDSKRSLAFWTMCMMIQPIVDFGHSVSSWLHSCPCNCDPKRKCILKGRRAIELACGEMDVWIGKLKALSLTKFAAAAHRKLEAEDAETASCLLTDWNNARGAVQLRMQQSFGFWKDAPWSILRIGECLVHATTDLNGRIFWWGGKEFSFIVLHLGLLCLGHLCCLISTSD